MPILAQGTPDVSQAPPSFLFQPKDATQPFFSLEMEAGTSRETTVLIGAEGDVVVPAKTYAADAYSLINGGFGVRELGEPVNEPTTWLDYESSDLELQPGQQIERTFTVSVPAGTPPGQYITGLIVQTAEPIAVGSSTMLQQTLRKALAVLITVPGPVTPEFSIGEASLRQSDVANSLLVDVTNSGNILLKPTGELVLTDAEGTELVTAPIAMGSVYAGDLTQIEVPIPTLLAPATYLIAITLTDEATGATASNPELALDVSAMSDASPVAALVTVDTFTVEAVADTSGGIQLANVAVVLNNAGTAIPAVKLTMHVLNGGNVVEDYALSPSLALPSGITTIEQRYIPATGWQSGTYSFSLTVEAVDLTTGQTTLLQSIDAASDVTVP
jgi:hypothetical protein